ncbi:MAG: HNH endonuclease [Cyanobacteriota bacterium]
MHARDAVFLEDLCPKLRDRRWRQSIHDYTKQRCIYCGNASESIDHVMPRSRGGLSITENCVPACLACNGHKSDADAFDWYRRQRFYDPRRAMAIRAWVDGDLRLAIRLLQWATPETPATAAPASGTQRRNLRSGRPDPSQRGSSHPQDESSHDTWDTRWGLQPA